MKSTNTMSLQRADNWFWVLNVIEDGYGVDVERVVAWDRTGDEWVGLISPELSGGVLKKPPPFAGGIYKHYSDLTPRELKALENKRRDPEPAPYRHWEPAGAKIQTDEPTQQNVQ